MPDRNIEEIHRRASALVRLAEMAGVVLTIEQVPLHPPAGNYETRVSVRPARGPRTTPRIDWLQAQEGMGNG